MAPRPARSGWTASRSIDDGEMRPTQELSRRRAFLILALPLRSQTPSLMVQRQWLSSHSGTRSDAPLPDPCVRRVPTTRKSVTGILWHVFNVSIRGVIIPRQQPPGHVYAQRPEVIERLFPSDLAAPTVVQAVKEFLSRLRQLDLQKGNGRSLSPRCDQK